VVPYILRRAIRALVPVIIEDIEGKEWTAYTKEDLLLEVDIKSSRGTGLIFRSLYGLSAKINDALYLLYNPREELDI